MKFLNGSAAFLGLFAFGLTSVSAQTTWYVDVNHPSGPGSGTAADPYVGIQLAISASATQHGDTILVRPGTYYENLFVTKSLTLRGTGGLAQTEIVGSATPAPAVRFVPQAVGLAPTVLEEFTIREGTGLRTGTQALGGGHLLRSITHRASRLRDRRE